MPVPCAGNDRFVTLSGARRVWAVSSVHGQAARLRALHEELGERFDPHDRLVYLGNILGRGDHIVDTIDEILNFRRAILSVPGMRVCDLAYLRGSQEEMWQKLLQLHIAVEPAKVLAWMLDRGVGQTLAAYGGEETAALRRARSGAFEVARWTNELRRRVARHPGHQELMTTLRRAAFTAGGELLFVHSGLDPARPLDTQSDAFWWGTDGFSEIKEPYSGFKKVIRGYAPDHPGIAVGPHSATVDCGAGFGGALAAACFDLSGETVDQIIV